MAGSLEKNMYPAVICETFIVPESFGDLVTKYSIKDGENYLAVKNSEFVRHSDLNPICIVNNEEEFDSWIDSISGEEQYYKRDCDEHNLNDVAFLIRVRREYSLNLRDDGIRNKIRKKDIDELIARHGRVRIDSWSDRYIAEYLTGSKTEDWVYGSRYTAHPSGYVIDKNELFIDKNLAEKIIRRRKSSDKRRKPGIHTVKFENIRDLTHMIQEMLLEYLGANMYGWVRREMGINCYNNEHTKEFSELYGNLVIKNIRQIAKKYDNIKNFLELSSDVLKRHKKFGYQNTIRTNELRIEKLRKEDAARGNHYYDQKIQDYQEKIEVMKNDEKNVKAVLEMVKRVRIAILRNSKRSTK